MNGRKIGSELFVVANRELRTVARTPALVALAAVFVASIVGVAWAGTGGGGGYVPLIFDLLTFSEILIPVLAFAFGYRAILDDRLTGELDMVRTFGVSRIAYVGGVYLGRATVLVGLVVVSLVGAGLLVPMLTAEQPTFLAQNHAADSALRFVRFVVLSAVFTLVTLSVSVAVSTAARTLRTAFALATAFTAAFVIGIDTTLLAGLAAELFPAENVSMYLALSPNSAFRGLVLSGAVGVVGGASVDAGSPSLNALSLFVWWFLGLTVAGWRVWPDVSSGSVESGDDTEVSG
ncbi:ABC transporter permease [Haladaptatus sp. NG-WS-4]